MSEELKQEVLAMLNNNPQAEVVECHAIGSRVTCDPPVMDTDRDILVLCKDILQFGSQLIAMNWETGTSLSEDASKMDFVSLRKGDVNIIAVDKPEFLGRFLAATSVAKRLNIKEKPDRIALFQAVLYGKACG